MQLVRALASLRGPPRKKLPQALVASSGDTQTSRLRLAAHLQALVADGLRARGPLARRCDRPRPADLILRVRPRPPASTMTSAMEASVVAVRSATAAAASGPATTGSRRGGGSTSSTSSA